MSTDKPHDRCLSTSSGSSSYFSAKWIGQPAREILDCQKRFTVRGVTSRGIFLETEDAWITFLSKETYRGPLTLNIERFEDYPWVEPGMIGCIEDRVISFEIVDLRVSYADALGWNTYGRAVIKNEGNLLAMRNTRTASLIDHLRQLRQSPNEYLEAALLFYLTGHFDENSDLSPRLALLTQAFLTGNLAPAESAINFLVGRGLGLTPSGDDFLNGLLYSLALCNQYRSPRGQSFRDAVLSSIRARSTTISSNLAECAAAGEVDERIFHAADYLINGHSSEQTIVEGILAWGSSSGTDTIAGFLLGLKAVELSSDSF